MHQRLLTAMPHRTWIKKRDKINVTSSKTYINSAPANTEHSLVDSTRVLLTTMYCYCLDVQAKLDGEKEGNCPSKLTCPVEELTFIQPSIIQIMMVS